MKRRLSASIENIANEINLTVRKLWNMGVITLSESNYPGKLKERLGDKAPESIYHSCPLEFFDRFTMAVICSDKSSSISLPCGFTDGGLPVGLQQTGKHFDESTVLQAAHAYEQSTDWHKRKPSL